MLLNLIEDINRSLDNNCFFSALSLALTLPDICGMAMFPNEKSTKKRYIDWYNLYIGAYEQCPGEEGKMPYLSGEVVYQLRCSFLHEGNPNIDEDKITEECCKIDCFTLLIESKKEFDCFIDSTSSERCYKNNKIEYTQRNYEVNVRRLCFILTACAKAYYKKYPEQFSFFNFNVVNLDERNKQLEEQGKLLWK